MLVLPVDDERGASTRYRVLAHLPALEAAGYRPRVRFPLRLRNGGPLRRVWRVADIVRDLHLGGGADLLFVHRKTYPAALAGRLKGLARRRVFDMDDAIDLPPPSRLLDAAAKRRYRNNFEATVGAFDLVLCGNRELASRLPHGRYELLPTPIDTRLFAPGDRLPARTLGWVGHADNLPSLEKLEAPLRELARRHPGLRLIVVADRPPRLSGIEVEFRPCRLSEEVSCFGDMRIGLMPLDDTAWTRGKCSFKAIQYMALGIPAVASPVGMNTEVLRHGETGFLPGSDREWVEVLDRLLSDDVLTRAVGQAGRREVEQHYSLDVVGRRLLSILDALR